MLPVIKLQSRFTLVILIAKADKEKMERMVSGIPDIKFTQWRPHPMDGFIEFRADVNVRQAELIRQLLKNIKVYD